MRSANAPARDLAFPSLRQEVEKTQRLFAIDIEQSFRDWMSQLGGDPDVHAHGEPISPEFGRDLDLTNRERECLSLMACGYTKRQVGEILFIGMETVKQYTKRVNQKLGAKNVNQAAMIAACVGELDVALMREHLFRAWESGSPTATPGTPIAA
jgi:DNA-binding CsgD family transcriptional regulator